MIYQKKIRHWIYRDYYLLEETEAELVEWTAHIGRLPYSKLNGADRHRSLRGDVAGIHYVSG